MRAPVSWLREYVDGAPVATGREVAASLVRVGLEEEGLHGGDITGPLVVGRVLEFDEQRQKNGKPIRWCQVDVGQHGQQVTEGTPQGIICGATNFAVGDLVVVVLPGGVLPGGFAISARKTYGHISNGMICSAAELGLGSGTDASDGIIVLQTFLGEEDAAKLTPGDDAIGLLGLADEVVEVNVTPDRGYCLSMRGMAREYAHATGGTFRDPAASEAVAPAPANTSGYPVQLADEAPLNGRAGCDRYVARVVRAVSATASSPPWMQKRLTQMGMRPISLAVDVTNYVMLLLGQPLHAFDVSALRGPIVVRRARAGETLTTLDDVVRTLYPQDLLITDGGTAVLAIAGVMGGATSEVGASTTDVLVESAHFDPTSVARSSRRHRLTTEASMRFERGVDPDVTGIAAQLAVNLLVELGGGTADDGVTDVDRRLARPRVDLDAGLPARLIGLPYSHAQVIETLREIGCDVLEPAVPEVETAAPSVLSVLPPSWRPDLADGPDFAEEVVRLRGYDQIPSVLPRASSGRGLNHGQRVRRVLANTLAGQGFVEVLTYPFVAPKSHDDLGLPPNDPRRTALRIANPLSEEAPLMRTSVLSTMVEALRRNVSRGARDTAVFEIGLVTRPLWEPQVAPVPGTYERPDDVTLAQIMAAVPPQPRRVAFALTGDSDPAGWWGPGRHADWTDAVGAARAVAAALSVDVVISADDHAPWHPGRCARLGLSDGTLVGHAGELHPKVAAALGLPSRTCAGELDVDVLTAASEPAVQARELSTYPVAQSDVALVVAEQTAAADVESALRLGAGDMLESIWLMDIYRGDQVGTARKSLAYRLVFRAPDRTLTTKEVNRLRDRAIAAAATAVGAVQRGA